MTEEEINKLPSRTYKHGTDERCSICLCDFSCGDKLSLLPCSHEEHSECLVEWLKVSGNAVKHTCTDQNKTNPSGPENTKPLWTRKYQTPSGPEKTNLLWSRKTNKPLWTRKTTKPPLDQKNNQTPSASEKQTNSLFIRKQTNSLCIRKQTNPPPPPDQKKCLL